MPLVIGRIDFGWHWHFDREGTDVTFLASCGDVAGRGPQKPTMARASGSLRAPFQ